MLKKLKFQSSNKILWYFLKKKRILVLSIPEIQPTYILFNEQIKIQKIKKTYFLIENKKNFYNFLLKWIEHHYKPLQKKIFFKGLGFKFRYSNIKKDKLELKIGFSHFYTILIPKKEIKVFLIKKNRLAIESFNYSSVGNFVEKIRKLRFPDSYNGKGFWYKNVFKPLKQVKKS